MSVKLEGIAYLPDGASVEIALDSAGAELFSLRQSDSAGPPYFIQSGPKPSVEEA